MTKTFAQHRNRYQESNRLNELRIKENNNSGKIWELTWHDPSEKRATSKVYTTLKPEEYEYIDGEHRQRLNTYEYLRNEDEANMIGMSRQGSEHWHNETSGEWWHTACNGEDSDLPTNHQHFLWSMFIEGEVQSQDRIADAVGEVADHQWTRQN